MILPNFACAAFFAASRWLFYRHPVPPELLVAVHGDPKRITRMTEHWSSRPAQSDPRATAIDEHQALDLFSQETAGAFAPRQLHPAKGSGFRQIINEAKRPIESPCNLGTRQDPLLRHSTGPRRFDISPVIADARHDPCAIRRRERRVGLQQRLHSIQCRHKHKASHYTTGNAQRVSEPKCRPKSKMQYAHRAKVLDYIAVARFNRHVFSPRIKRHLVGTFLAPFRASKWTRRQTQGTAAKNTSRQRVPSPHACFC